jgi:hypothetical protein
MLAGGGVQSRKVCDGLFSFWFCLVLLDLDGGFCRFSGEVLLRVWVASFGRLG